MFLFFMLVAFSKTIVEQGSSPLLQEQKNVESEDLSLLPEWDQMVVVAQATKIPDHFSQEHFQKPLHELISIAGPVLCETSLTSPTCYTCRNQDNLFEYHYYFDENKGQCTLQKYSLKRKESGQLVEIKDFFLAKQIQLPEEMVLPIAFNLAKGQVELQISQDRYTLSFFDTEAIAQAKAEKEALAFLSTAIRHLWTEYLEHSVAYISELDLKSEMQITAITNPVVFTDITDAEKLEMAKSSLEALKKRSKEGKACLLLETRKLYPIIQQTAMAKDLGLFTDKPWLESFSSEIKGTVCGNFVALEWLKEALFQNSICKKEDLQQAIKILSLIDTKNLPPIEKRLYKLLSFTLDLRQASFSEKITFDAYKDLEDLQKDGYLEKRLLHPKDWTDADLLQCKAAQS